MFWTVRFMPCLSGRRFGSFDFGASESRAPPKPGLMTSRTRRPRGDREECAAVEATANGEAEAEYLEILGVLRSIGALKTTYSNYYGPYSRVVGRWVSGLSQGYYTIS